VNYANQYGPDWQQYGTYEPVSYAPGGYVPPPRPSVSMAPTAPASVAASVAPAAAAAVPAAATSSFIPGAGLALSGVGTLLNAYGTYKQSQAMDEQAKLEQENFDLQKALAFQDRAASDEERRRQAILQGGQYAQGLQDRSLSRYGEYVRRTGG